MQILSLLMPLLGFVAFVAFVWLLVVAFRQSALWGILVLLFSPITAIIFAIKNWDEARKPFLIYMGTSVASVAIMIGMLAFMSAPMVRMASQMQDGELSDTEAIGAFEETMDRMENSGMLDYEDKKELAKMREMLGEMKEDAPAPADPGEQETAAEVIERFTREQAASNPPRGTDIVAASSDPVPTGIVTSTRDRVALHQIEQHVGKTLRVVINDGTEFVGRYVGRQDGELEFEKRLSSGTLVVHYPRGEVESVHKVHRR